MTHIPIKWVEVGGEYDLYLGIIPVGTIYPHHNGGWKPRINNFDEIYTKTPLWGLAAIAPTLEEAKEALLRVIAGEWKSPNE